MGQLIFYLNGRFIPESDAKISVLDLGFVRGFGVFDFLRTYHGQPFKLDAHLRRLKSSADQIGLNLPFPIAKIKELVLETFKKNTLKDANIKIIVTGGISPDQITPAGKPTLAILIYPLAVYPPSHYIKGVKVITVDNARIYPTAKTINYIPAIMALTLAKTKGAIDAIYTNSKKEVLEGTTTNFFIFKKETLITAKEGILGGITREVILEIAKKEFEVKLRAISYDELKEIDEAFISNSSKEIMPVVKIDSITVGSGRVGKNTKRIMDLFKTYTQRE